MNQLKDCPGVLVRKFLFTILIGAGCFVVGAAFFLLSKDVITLALSGAVLLLCIVRGILLYHTIKHQNYEVVEGTVISISTKPLRKYFVIKIMDKDAIESTLRLGKETRVKIGFRYLFYFNKGTHPTLGNDYFDTALASNQFLGFEELGETATETE